MPSETLPVTGDTLVEQIVSLEQDVFKPFGFTVESFTKLPYLCEGDLEHSFYVLQDIVFVLKCDSSVSETATAPVALPIETITKEP